MLVKIVNYNFYEIWNVFKNCFYVVITSAPLPLILYLYKDKFISNYIVREFSLCTFGLLCVVISVWFVGFNKETRLKMRTLVIEKIKLSK